MERNFRERVLLPVAIPLGAFGVIGLIVFSMSRILLTVPKEMATVIALAVALDILVICAILSARPSSRAAYAMVALLGGGIIVAGLSMTGQASRLGEHEAAPVEHGGEGAGGEAGAVAIAAKGLQFDKPTIEVPAGAPVSIQFRNEDSGVPHNVAVYETAAADQAIFKGEIFKGEIFNGVKTKTYTFDPPPPGTYAFRCDVHPSMKGQLVVKPAAEGAGSGQGAAAAAGAVTVGAKNLQFDKKELAFPAGQEVTLEFKNQDSGVPHNVAVYRTEAAAEAIFKGEVFNGVATRKYRFTAPAAGTYFFRCDVHPSMKGQVVVR